MGNNGLLWSVPLAIVGAALLLMAIHRLIRTIKEAVIAKVPLQESSLVTFEEVGRVQLHREGPRFSFAFAGLQYEIVGSETGSRQRLPISRSLIRVRSTGFGTARELYGDVLIPEPGRYELRVHGIRNPKDVARCSIVFARPYTMAMMLCILGIVFAAMALIGGIVVSSLFLAGVKTH